MKDEDIVYHDLLGHVMHLLEHKLPPTMIAAALMAIAQRLYKTHLSEPEYKRLMDYMTTVEIEPYEIKKERLH